MGMTDNTIARVQAGVPTGGEFAKRNRTEGDIDLNAPSPAVLAMDGARTALHEAKKSMARLTIEAAAERALAHNPDVTEMSFELVDDLGHDYLHFRGSFDKDGLLADITPAGRDEVQTMIEELDDHQYFRDAGLSIDQDNTDLWLLETKPTQRNTEVWEVSSEIASVHVAAEVTVAAINARQFELGVAGVTGTVKDVLPDAASVVLWDMNDGPGSPYFQVGVVEDADGNQLWNYNDGDDDYADSFGEFAPFLDRNIDALEALEKDYNGRTKYRLNF